MERRKTTAVSSCSAVAAGVLSLFAAGANATDLAPVKGNLPAGALPSAWDPTYNVCRGTDSHCYHDWAVTGCTPNANPDLPATGCTSTRQNKVLIYSRTAGPRHANIGTALTAGINTQTRVSPGVFTSCTPSATCPTINANNVAQATIRAWLNEQDIQVDITEDANRMVSGTSYKAVIFMSNSRDAMWKHGTAISTSAAVDTTTNAYLDAAKVNLRQFMRAGGGFVAIHNAFGTEYNWPYYEGLLGNANYYDHGAAQKGIVKIVGSADPITAGVAPPAGTPFPAGWNTLHPKYAAGHDGTTFAFNDEWYNFLPYPTNVKFLATVDDDTFATKHSTHPGHGSFHPVAWCQFYDGGRVFATTMGHQGDAFAGSGSTVSSEGQAAYKKLIVQGILAAMGNVNDPVTGQPGYFCPK